MSYSSVSCYLRIINYYSDQLTKFDERNRTCTDTSLAWSRNNEFFCHINLQRMIDFQPMINFQPSHQLCHYYRTAKRKQVLVPNNWPLPAKHKRGLVPNNWRDRQKLVHNIFTGTNQEHEFIHPLCVCVGIITSPFTGMTLVYYMIPTWLRCSPSVLRRRSSFVVSKASTCHFRCVIA